MSKQILLLILVVSPLLAYASILKPFGEKKPVHDDPPHITRRIVRTKLAPTPIGPYNQAIQIDDMLYVSGTIGIDPKTNELVEGGIVNETHQALQNIGAILDFVNCTYFNVFKVNVMLANISNFSLFNGVYSQYFTEKFPARAVYQAAALVKGAQVEIEALAAVGNITDILSN